jgi:ribosomal protein S12 methylthiotransferase
MTDLLSAAGYRISNDCEHADVVVVNTCSFIQAATEESIDAILEAAGYDNVAHGGAQLVVAGCMPARYATDLETELPEVSRFVPCAEEEKIVEILDELLAAQRESNAQAPLGYEAQFTKTDEDALETSDKLISAYVKISDGCNRFCAYCTIPFIRGRYHSFAQDDIDREVSRLIAKGAREIVLIAQDTGRWGDDFDEKSSLANLLDYLACTHADTWFRVMYIQPEGVTEELIEVFAVHDNICKYFDIPFQHCDQEILASMNRKGSGEEYLDLIGRIRNRIPDVTLRTTLIAGYPGESDEQFESLCDFVEELEFDYVGVFPYSREEGTRAYKLEGQLDEEEKIARAQRIRDIADAVSSAVISRRIGRNMDILLCGEEEDGQLFGRAQCQAPDVDGVTYVSSGILGEIVSVEIVDTLLYEMEGEPAS